MRWFEPPLTQYSGFAKDKISPLLFLKFSYTFYHNGVVKLYYLDQMYHSIPKEDHVHASTPYALIVMAQERVQTVLQTLK